MIQTQLDPYLNRLRELDFIQGVELIPDPNKRYPEADGILRIGTPNGRFKFYLELKNSYLDRAHINALIAHAKHYEGKENHPTLLLARYVPTPSAEKLTDAGVNFVDRVGNMHITLGTRYSRTVIGRRESQKPKEPKVITAARAQLLFTFAACEEASTWNVRQLAEASGTSKSNAASLRKQFVQEGLLTSKLRLRDRRQLEGQLLNAYEQCLRPKLLINRFRAAESSTDKLIESIRGALAKSSLPWSLTGAQAAFELQGFYNSPEISIFVESLSETVLRECRVLVDQNGPLTFLRAFGTLPFWKQVNTRPIAHPWLIYCELMCANDPRAHEAAEQLKAEYLK